MLLAVRKIRNHKTHRIFLKGVSVVKKAHEPCACDTEECEHVNECEDVGIVLGRCPIHLVLS
jgi:hypothetical protein